MIAEERLATVGWQLELPIDIPPDGDDGDLIAAFVAYRDNANPYEPSKAPIPY
jgi:hypothetical protein